jgi:hypothetical protein
MNEFQLTMIAFVAIPSMAEAHDWRGARAMYEPQAVRQEASAVPTGAAPAVAGMVRSANACGADHAEPVWGASAAPLGYTCLHNENGG